MDRQGRYTELLKRHLPMVWRLCWVRARGNYERCRDLVQEVSIALWLHLDQLRTDVSPQEERAWVRWLTRTTLDHLHRHQRPPMLALTDIMAETISDDDNKAVAEDIEELMAVLSPEERQLLRLHIEGYHADEIAELMGLRRDTVYQRMHRALSKARKALLLLLLTLVVSSIAVAVVPRWRQWFFGVKEPVLADTFAVSDSVPFSPAPPMVADTIRKAQPPQCAERPFRDTILYLVASVDTSLPVLLPDLSEPCGCPEGYRRKEQTDSLGLFSDACEPLPDEPSEVTIMVVGNNIVVEGANDETVDVFDAQGRLVATAQCSGHCTLIVRNDNRDSRAQSFSPFWVQVGSRPRQRVFLGNLKGEWIKSQGMPLF